MAESKLSTEEEILFFVPLIEHYVEQLEAAFMKKNKRLSSEQEWVFVVDENESGKFPKHYLLEKIWDEYVLYMKGEVKLYCFIEEQTSGLASKKSKYWLFFSPKIANDYFTKQLERPKGFDLKKIITIPVMNLYDPVVERLELVLANNDMNLKLKIVEFVKFLDIALTYFNKSQKQQFDAYFPKATYVYVFNEVQSLQKDIYNTNISAINVQKRLQYIFKICWRYFRTRNELESRYYKKLTLVDNEEVIKGLRLAKKKLIDFKASLK